MEDSLKKDMVLMIRALYFSIIEEWSVIVKAHQLSSAQQHILYILASSDGPLTMSEVSKLGCWHLSTFSRLIKPLENEGFVSIQSGKGRIKWVSLTDSGKQKLKTIADDVLEKGDFPFHLQGFSRETLKDFTQIGMQILQNHKGKDFTRWLQSSEPKALSISLKQAE